MHEERDVGRQVLRRHTLVASADKAWAIRWPEGTGGEMRHGWVFSDKIRQRGRKRGCAWTVDSVHSQEKIR
jgi:hypothetical protein